MSEATRSILVVDDNEMNRDVLSRRLQRQGYDVAVAVDGKQALELIAARAFALVLLDIEMPGLSGLEVLQIIRQTHTAAELLQEPADEEERTAREEAEEWLRDFLADGPRPTTKVLPAAKKAGIAERTLWRAKQRIGVKSKKATGTLEGPWCWTLPSPPPGALSISFR